MNRTVKYIAIIFAVIIMVLLGVLAFVNPPQKEVLTISPDGRVKVEVLRRAKREPPETINGSVTGGGNGFSKARFQ